VSLRLVAPRHFSTSELTGRLSRLFDERGNELGLSGSGALPWNTSHILTPVALQAQAGIAAGLVTEASATLWRLEANASCGWTDTCFCGNTMCPLDSLEGWSPTEPLDLEGVTHSSPSVQEERREYVHVVWGLKTNDSASFAALRQGQNRSSGQTPFFKPGFLPDLPQAQRDIYRFCSDLPRKDLHVAQELCWMSDFRTWRRDQSERFPVPLPGFHAAARSFSSAGGAATANPEYLWRANDGTVRAFYASFAVDVTQCLTNDGVDAYRKRWDRYVAEWNSAAHGSATGAWHTSRLWDQHRPTGGSWPTPYTYPALGAASASNAPGWAPSILALAGLLRLVRLPLLHL